MDEKELTAQTNDEEVEVEEVAEPDAEELQDETEFTESEGENETEVAEPSEENEEKSGQESTKEEREERAVQAEKRRKREAQEKELREQIRQESYQKGLLDAVGKTNPYTGEEMKDELDVQEFLTMREIEKKGGDPVGDYRKTVKERERERKAAGLNGNAEENGALSEFVRTNPNVDVNKLLNDPKFCKFAGKRVSHESLQDIYNDYLSFTSEIDAKVEEKADAKAKNAIAKAKASPGSLSGNSDPMPVSYADMSDEEFEKVIAKAKRGELKKS